jgi:hypothetical protein
MSIKEVSLIVQDLLQLFYFFWVPAPKRKRARCYRHRACCHRKAGKRGIQQAHCGDRYQDDVLHERVDKVLLYLADHFSGYFNGRQVRFVAFVLDTARKLFLQLYNNGTLQL